MTGPELLDRGLAILASHYGSDRRTLSDPLKRGCRVFFLSHSGRCSSRGEPERIRSADEAISNRAFIDIDNDSSVLTNTDRDYTNGIRFTLQRIPTQPEPAQGDKPQSRSTYGFHVGHNTYTPSDITLPPSQINRADRPYAAWLYAGVYKEERRPTSEAWRYELNLGCIGPCAQGERVQTEWHEFVGAPIPQGWDAQIRNAPGVLARIEYSPRVFTSAPKVWEFLPAFTADIGNIFLRAGMEGTFRLGKIVLVPVAVDRNRSLQ